MTSSRIGVGRDTTGTFSQSGNSTVMVSNRMLIGGVDGGGAGLATAQGTYNMSSKAHLTFTPSTNFNVGDLGTGVFNQSSGTVNDDGFPLTIGATNNSTSNGTYNLGGTGTLNIATNGGTNGATDLYVGAGNSSIGLLTQTGGTLTRAAGQCQVASGAGLTGTLAISSGRHGHGRQHLDGPRQQFDGCHQSDGRHAQCRRQQRGGPRLGRARNGQLHLHDQRPDRVPMRPS